MNEENIFKDHIKVAKQFCKIHNGEIKGIKFDHHDWCNLFPEHFNNNKLKEPTHFDNVKILSNCVGSNSYILVESEFENVFIKHKIIIIT